MRRNLGCYQSRDRAAGVGIEVEAGSLAVLESEEPGPRDHGGIVGGKSRTGRKDCYTLGLQSGAHRGGERPIAGNSAAEDESSPGKAESSTRSFLDKGVDQRVLESARNIGLVCFNVLGVPHRVEHGSLETAERERVIVFIVRQRVFAHHWPAKLESFCIAGD